MKDGEGLWGEMRAGVGGGGVKVQKYTSAIQYLSGEIFFRAKKFLLDDDGELSAIGSDRLRTEFL